jgi:hypothetical protein
MTDHENPQPIRGRCLCGAVEFALTPPTDFFAHCHCQSCRLAHGAGLTSWTSVPLDRFTVLGGAERISWYRSSECIEWGFCGICGSSMLYRAVREGHPESPRLDRMYVTVASLLDPMDREPQAHVSYEERVPWLQFTDSVPKHRGKTDERIDE